MPCMALHYQIVHLDAAWDIMQELNKAPTKAQKSSTQPLIMKMGGAPYLCMYSSIIIIYI